MSSVLRAAAEKVVTAAYARTMAMPLEREVHSCRPGTVARVEEPAPWLRRLTLHVPTMEGYAVLGPDEFVGLVMPRPGAGLPDLSSVTGPNPRPVIAAMPEATRPDVRWYTVREWRPATCELVVEVVLHPQGEVEEGPGARWVRRAAPGEQVAVQTGTTCYHPDPAQQVRVVAGDETAYPAVVGIVEAARGTDAELHVLLEVERDGVLPPVPEPRRGSLTVVQRQGRPVGDRLVEAVAGLALERVDYGWVAGEQELAAGVRRQLVRGRGVPRTSVYHCAYWIQGRPRG